MTNPFEIPRAAKFPWVGLVLSTVHSQLCGHSCTNSPLTGKDAFQTLKARLSSAPIVAFPRSPNTFVLDTDASEQGIGAVLFQNQDGVECVIAYGSRTLTKSERNYCATRRELLALVHFMPHFCSYRRSWYAQTTHRFAESSSSRTQRAGGQVD